MTEQSAVQKLRQYGIGGIARRKAAWYRDRFRGWLIARRGNLISMDGMTYSVDSPTFPSTLKATLANGHHEFEERALTRSWVPADVPIVELGGGLGVVSCLANKKLARPADHIVVEANPAMVPLLERNRGLNRCNFTVVNKAVGYNASTLELEIDGDFVGSSAKGMTHAAVRAVSVKTTTVAEVMDQMGFETAGIICDIEGTEADLIEREFPRLGERIRYIMAETHPAVLGELATAAMLNQLVAQGFVERQRMGDCIFYSRD